MGPGVGDMGKFARGVAASLFVVLFVSGAAEARNPKLQTKLPSEVKKVKIRAAKKPKAPLVKTVKKAVPQEEFQEFNEWLKSEPKTTAEIDKGVSAFDDKFISKTVHFAASTAPVPEEYGCDSSIEEKQMRQAELDALAKCEADGEEHCRLHQIKIIKTGELRCEDIPGRDCGVRKFYRGCVAQAIVVGEKNPEEQASIF